MLKGVRVSQIPPLFKRGVPGLPAVPSPSIVDCHNVFDGRMVAFTRPVEPEESLVGSIISCKFQGTTAET